MISLLVPSRGRPDLLARLADSIADTASTERAPGAWELLVRLDEDDPRRDEYLSYSHHQALNPQTNIGCYVGPRTVLSECWNELWRVARGDIFWHGGDDNVFRTPGWDELIRDAFPPDRLAFVHGDDDGGKGFYLGTHGFVSRAWTDTVGTFVPPYFASDYNDLWLNKVAEIIDRRVWVGSVHIEHLHPGFEKRPFDQTDRDRIARHVADNVDRTWANTVEERLEWAVKLRAAIRNAA